MARTTARAHLAVTAAGPARAPGAYGLLLAAAAVLTTAAAAGAPASAVAAAPWAPPVTIAAAHGVGPTRVGAAETMTSTVAWWSWQDGAASGSQFGVSTAAQPAGSEAFDPERSRSSRELISLDVQGYGDGRLIALSEVLGPPAVRTGQPNAPQRILLSSGDGDGLRAPTTLARANVVGAPQLDVASSGRAIVAFASYDPKIAHRAIVSAAVRSSSGKFSRPSVISGRGDAHGVAVAIGRRGDMVVAFVRNRNVVARVRRPGHGWGPIQTLATPTGPTQWTLRAAVSDAGSIEVLWHKRFVSDRTDGAALQARRMSPGASRWATRTTVEPIGASSPSALVVMPGAFAVGYTVRDAAGGSPSTPRVALLTAHASTRLDVAAPSVGARDVQLAWSPRDGLFATMIRPTPDPNANDGTDGLGAFLAPGATSFGPIEVIAPTGNITPTFNHDGTPLAVWSAAPDTGPDGTPPSRVVRTSTRTG
jgi:hypothetical protein